MRRRAASDLLAPLTCRESVTLANEGKIFFGDLHGHTDDSDGRLLPADAHRHARDVAKLDFFVLTDHLEHVDALEWADTRETAFKANEDGRFVALPGLEWTKQAGHLNLFDPPSVTWPRDVEGMYRAAAKAEVLGMFNPRWSSRRRAAPRITGPTGGAVATDADDLEPPVR